MYNILIYIYAKATKFIINAFKNLSLFITNHQILKSLNDKDWFNENCGNAFQFYDKQNAYHLWSKKDHAQSIYDAALLEYNNSNASTK